MNGEIIYEKDYAEQVDEMFLANNRPQTADEKKAQSLLASRICKKTFQDIVTVAIPGKVMGKDQFILKAKKVGEHYLIHTVIREYMDKVTVTFSLDNEVPYAAMRDLIIWADDFYCDVENNVVLLTLDYYTHATYRGDRKVLPIENPI